MEDLLLNGLEVAVGALTAWGLRVLGAVLILIGGYLTAGWVAGSVRRWAEREDRVDPTIRPLMVRLIRFGILAIAIVAVLSNFGIQTASLVALLGAAGLAIGLSLQGTLSNVASGVMLLTLRPLQVGEVVEVSGHLGEVVEIGLFATTLRMFDGVIVYLPNTSVWSGSIRNFSRNGTRRFEVTVGIAYSADIDAAMRSVREVLASDPRILPDPAPSVFVQGLGDSSVDLCIRGWCAAGETVGTGNDIRKAVKCRFDSDGISIPFPQREVRLLGNG
jgi:small conductance mechanosensitive channel